MRVQLADVPIMNGKHKQRSAWSHCCRTIAIVTGITMEGGKGPVHYFLWFPSRSLSGGGRSLPPHFAYCSVRVLSTSLCCQSLPLSVRLRGAAPLPLVPPPPGKAPTRGASEMPPAPMDEELGPATPLFNRAEEAAIVGAPVRAGRVDGGPFESPSVFRLWVKRVELGGATAGGSSGRPIRIEVSAALHCGSGTLWFRDRSRGSKARKEYMERKKSLRHPEPRSQGRELWSKFIQ